MIEEKIFATLQPLAQSVYANELPQSPNYPAIVFRIETASEDGWVFGVVYERHELDVVVLCKSRAEILATRDNILESLRQMVEFIDIDHHGDAEFEGDANLFAYTISASFRTGTHLKAVV